MKAPISFGTYKLHGEALNSALKLAWQSGIRRFDTARLYANEAEVAKFLSTLDVYRDEEVLITTKFWFKKEVPMEQIAKDIATGSCKTLRYSDNVRIRVLLHHACPLYVWRVLEDLKSKGFCDSIGVSNHSAEALSQVLSIATVRPCVNQLEVHPLLPKKELSGDLYYCFQQSIPVEAHSIFCRGVALTSFTPSPSAAQLVKWALSQPSVYSVCVNATQSDHLQEILSYESAQQIEFNVETPPPRLRIYPLREPSDLKTAIPINIDVLVEKISGEILFVESQLRIIDCDRRVRLPSFNFAGLIPHVKSKYSDLSRTIALRLYLDDMKAIHPNETLDRNVAACYLRYHTVTRNLRSLFEDACNATNMVAAKTANGVDSGRVCLLKKKISGGASAPMPDNEFSVAITEPTPMPVTVADLSKLAPVFSFLSSNRPIPIDKEFMLGAVRPDAVDMCKQVVGPHLVDLCRSVQVNTSVKHFLLGNNIAFDGTPEQKLKCAEAMATLMRDPTCIIETWYLAGNCIDAEVMSVICPALVTNSVSKSLWLKRNPVKLGGVKALVPLLSVNHNISLLDLDNCGLMDEGVAALADCVTGLKHLYLDANGITPDGAVNVAKFIRNNSASLKSFYGSMNRFGDSGTISILNSLRGNGVMTRLALGSNRITDLSSQVLVEVVGKMPALKMLNVGFYKSTFDLGEQPNFFKDIQPFSELIRTSKGSALRVLDISMNSFSSDDVECLIEVCRRKNPMMCLVANTNVHVSKIAPAYNQKLFLDGGLSSVELRRLKHPKRVVHIDSIYRNKM